MKADCVSPTGSGDPRDQRRTLLLTKSLLATQLASEGSQAEQSATEQRNCRAAIGHPSRSNPQREPLVRSIPPRPDVGAGRHAEAGKGGVVKGHAVR